MSDSASDSEDDDDKSDDDDEDEAEETVSLFFFFFSGVFAFFTFSLGDFSVLDSGHLDELEDYNFGSGFSSLVAGRVLSFCSGSSFCSGFMFVSCVLTSVSIS